MGCFSQLMDFTIAKSLFWDAKTAFWVIENAVFDS